MGDDLLDMEPETKDESYPLFGKVPLPPVMIQQLDSKAFRAPFFLKRVCSNTSYVYSDLNTGHLGAAAEAGFGGVPKAGAGKQPQELDDHLLGDLHVPAQLCKDHGRKLP